LLQFFARWLPSPLVPSDLGAAGAALADAEDAALNAPMAAATHRSEAEAALAAAHGSLGAAAAMLQRLAREVAVREAQFEAPSVRRRSPGDA
jgi:hypothetical protein